MSEAATQTLTAEGKLREAEAVERETVSLLEKTGPESLLVDALIRHGITLARLGQTEMAEAELEKAIIVAVQLGTLDKAGLAALTMIEELNGLSAEALITNYEWASTWLTDLASLELLQRVNNAARKILVRLKGKIDHDEAVDSLLCRN
jgi:tetratricopeptide (TPR) repeat protein